MKNDNLTSKMFEMEIKDFSDNELRRVFKDCVAKNNLFSCARDMVDSGKLNMKDVYFLPCLGNDESMLDEEISYHKYHCGKCNGHLTSLYFCPSCGIRWQWVAAFDEAVGDSPAQQALFTPEADTAEGKLPATAPRR
jgi:hypothetical protein